MIDSDDNAAMEQYNRALDLFRTGEYDGAQAILAELVQANRVWLRPLLLQAYVFRALKNPVQEMQSLQELLARGKALADPGRGDTDMLADAWSLLGEVLVKLGECRLAVEAFLQSSALERDLQKKREEYSNAIFAANYCGDISDEKWQDLYKGYRKLLQDIVPQRLPLPYRHDRFRVGYLSGDVRRHPVADFLRPLLEYHDKERFQIYLYQTNMHGDDITQRLQGWADCIRVVSGMADEEIAGQIAADEIDVLVDLSGHTKGNRLPVLAYRPAAVILSGIGYFNSLGLAIDGFLSDVHCSPLAEQPAFSEKLLRLPHTHFCYKPFRHFPDVADKMAWQRNGYITFGCFNNFSKVTDEMLKIWHRIMQACPGSRLLLKHQLFDSAEGRGWTLRRMKGLGFSVGRVELRGFSENYLAEYRDMDIALDTFPYTGGITTLESLYMGVPVVSWYGSRHGTRFGLSFLRNIGISELAADNGAKYVQIAAGLAADKALLGLLHKNLRGMVEKSPLMDGRRYCREVEELYMCLLH